VIYRYKSQNFYYIEIMFRVFIMLAIFALLSCEEKEPVNEKVLNPYDPLIEKAKKTEAILQKKADSIIREQDELGIPR